MSLSVLHENTGDDAMDWTVQNPHTIGFNDTLVKLHIQLVIHMIQATTNCDTFSDNSNSLCCFFLYIFYKFESIYDNEPI